MLHHNKFLPTSIPYLLSNHLKLIFEFLNFVSLIFPQYALLDNKPLYIYGDGKQTRDFIFVSDVVRANISAADNKATSVYNVGSGKRLSINVLANDIIHIIGRKLKPVYKKARIGDIKDSLADISKVKKELNFKPKYSLIKGLNETINWFSQ